MPDVGGIASYRLRSFVDRIIRLEAEKKDVQHDIGEVYKEAKSVGFDTKALRRVVKEAQMDPEERDEQAALVDLYKGALGLLNGTPLGQAAIRRLTGQRPADPPQQRDIEEITRQPNGADHDGETAPEPEKPLLVSELDIQNARTAGRKAAQAGKPVTANEFPPHDPRRAAWDEGWCQAAGSDGMDIPEAFRRKKKAKPEAEGNAGDAPRPEGDGADADPPETSQEPPQGEPEAGHESEGEGDPDADPEEAPEEPTKKKRGGGRRKKNQNPDDQHPQA